jgi:hypothetical protein
MAAPAKEAANRAIVAAGDYSLLSLDPKHRVNWWILLEEATTLSGTGALLDRTGFVEAELVKSR